jgi:hypothetical protein
MPNHSPDAVARARYDAQRVLSQSPAFLQMSAADQLETYRNLVNRSLSQQPAAHSLSRPAARLARGLAEEPPTPPGGLARTDIENKRFDQLPQIGADFIQAIDFPQFVKDLLQGVFDANLKVTIQQMKTYQDLLKTASKSVGQFAKDIKEQEAFSYLAETQSDLFSLGFEDDEAAPGGRAIVLTDKDGNKLDLGDNEVKARIMDATIALAKERRAMLRETILMGISRLVVEKGVVEASVLFDVSAGENITSKGKTGSEDETTGATEDTGGWFSSIFGGDATTEQTRKSKITVSSVKAVADSKLAAQIKGSVKIQFKSDYFKLDNFASLYQDGRDGGAATAAAPGTAVARAPAVPTPPAAAGPTR